MRAPCLLDGCEKPSHGHGYCHTHYCRIWKSGDVHKGRVYTHTPADERYWSKVVLTDDGEACWGWTGARKSHGYGVLMVDGALMPAHRYSYVLHFGSIPEGFFVCHRCDNPPCTNPSHLFLGTHDDNMADMSHKDRAQRGILSMTAIATIRAERNRGVPYSDLATAFGVSPRTVRRAASSDVYRGQPG